MIDSMVLLIIIYQVSIIIKVAIVRDITRRGELLLSETKLSRNS